MLQNCASYSITPFYLIMYCTLIELVLYSLQRSKSL